MEFLDALQATGLSFLFLMLVFVPVERVFPARMKQKFFRPHWILDLCYFLGKYLLWNGFFIWLLSFFSAFLTAIFPIEFQVAIQSQPWVLQAFEVLILGDFFLYWGHRLQHKIPFLWRFHKIHHSPEHMDWLAAHREHPVDAVYTIALLSLPVFVMGFPLETLAGVLAFRAIWVIYIHSNVRLPIGPLKIIIGAPEIHHWHHELERDSGNYANISPLMDVIFGTYYCPDHEPEKFGIKEELSKNYVGQIVEPFLPEGTWKKIEDEIKRKGSKHIQAPADPTEN